MLFYSFFLLFPNFWLFCFNKQWARPEKNHFSFLSVDILEYIGKQEVETINWREELGFAAVNMKASPHMRKRTFLLRTRKQSSRSGGYGSSQHCLSPASQKNLNRKHSMCHTQAWSWEQHGILCKLSPDTRSYYSGSPTALNIQGKLR